MKCELCGREFRPEEAAVVCKSCPTLMSGSCNLVRCPNCGYEMVGEPRLLKTLKRLWRSRR